MHLVLEEKLGNKKSLDKEMKSSARPTFIVNDFDNDAIVKSPKELEDDAKCFDFVCAFCENNGNLFVIMKNA